MCVSMCISRCGLGFRGYLCVSLYVCLDVGLGFRGYIYVSLCVCLGVGLGLRGY